MCAKLNKLQLVSSLSWRLDRVVNLCLKSKSGIQNGAALFSAATICERVTSVVNIWKF